MNSVIFGETQLTIEQVSALARKEVGSELSQSSKFQSQISAGADFLSKLIEEEGVIYGVTTGYGDSCTTAIPMNLVDDLPHQLFTFHGCGQGRMLSRQEGRAVLAARLNSLSMGYSGVTPELLAQLNRLLEEDITPVIPAEGSVGASGDLTPLSYVAAVLCGQRTVYVDDNTILPTEQVFAERGITPLRLKPKEGLAIMNGTAVMTALACLAYERAEYLCELATRITSLMVWGAKGNAHHFDEILFSVKPHPGQQRVAARLRQDLHVGDPARNPNRLQDRYSLRCAPHVIGAVEDALSWVKGLIENELNSANDNPIIDAQGEHVLHGGHFYGGHIAMAMDTLKTQVANIADLLDRQFALVADPKFNHGLPANLSGAPAERAAINHGLKALQIGCSAWTAEALKHTMPASVFSRSTECHNQDKVSMGTIAARDCLRTLQLTEQVAASALIAACQSVHLRVQQNELAYAELSAPLNETLAQVAGISPLLQQDRELDKEMTALVRHISQRDLELY